LTIDSTVQKETLNKYGLSTETAIIGLAPGAEFGPAKKWPETHYATVAQAMCEQGHQVWLFGSAKDVAGCDSIKAQVDSQYHHQIQVLAGKTSLIEAVDLLACCQTVISNDSGLMHIAAAVGCNIVAIYGSTSPQYTPPLADNVEIVHTDIECRPCFKRECPLGHLKCLKELEPSKVLNSINRLHAIKVDAC
jgi:heptosyltransferase-2